MTVPGIDMVVATGLMAAIGPVARFAGPDKLVAYLGLNPSVHHSGEGRPRHGRITEQGRTHARTGLPGQTHEVRRLNPAWLTGQGLAFPDGGGGQAMLEALIAALDSIEDPRCEWK